MKDIDFPLPIKNGPTNRGFDYYFDIPAPLDISPYVYVENNKAASIPDHVIEPQKKSLVLLMHRGMAGADFKPEECLPNITRRSLNYINEQRDSKKPFFLYLSITVSHTPILSSKEFQGKTSTGPYDDFMVVIDDMIRQIVKTLKENKQLDNTVVVSASDNEYVDYIGMKDMEEKRHFPSYIYRGYKSGIYEGGHKIPLIVSWKGEYGKEIDDFLVSLVDFYTTFA